MKSPIILVNKILMRRCQAGFMVAEAMIAFSLMTLFFISTLALLVTMQNLHDTGVRNLENLKISTRDMDQFLLEGTFATSSIFVQKLYGNDTVETQVGVLTVLRSDYSNAWGRDSCRARFTFDQSKYHLYSQGINLGSGNVSTDIETRNGFAYLTADSSTASAPDFYIVDIRNPSSPTIVSSLDTGPGLSSLEVVGPYVYVTNTGSTNQLQVIDVSNRSSPLLKIKLKLPLPLASSTAPAAASIFYDKGFVYIGTQKWDGNEFAIINVSNPLSPQYSGGFDTDTLINDIYTRDGFAYLAASNEGQMRIIDIHDPSSPFQIGYFSPSGWETQEGKSLSYFEGKLLLGRTTGGFNVVTNHEVFIFSTTSPPTLPPTSLYSHDVPGGVYGSLMRPEDVFLTTRLSGKEFQIWNATTSAKISDVPLGFSPARFSCDGSGFYFATGNGKGIAAYVPD